MVNSPQLFRVVLFLGAGAAVVLLGYPQAEKLANDRTLLKPYDFVQYWSAGRQLLDGRDPYDPDQLVPIQRSMYDGVRKAVMMWNPPWTLPLTLPFAALPWRLAQFLWLGLQLTAVLVSADLLWRVYGGPERLRWAAWLVALTFAPTLFLLLMGQISGLLLLGLSGFLYFTRRGQPAAAGACAALTAIKPHLLLLFGLALLLEATRNAATRRSVIAGAVVLLVTGLLPLLWNQHVWSQYAEATRRPPSETFETMQEFEHPTVGYRLRKAIPGAPFAAQFVPAALVAVFVVIYWRRRGLWSWERELPLLVLLSVLTAGYGAWAFDLVVLLVPMFAALVWARLSRKTAIILAAGYLALNLLVLTTVTQPGSQSNPWIAPAVCVGCIAIVWRGREPVSS
jgi:hypothetical protein